MDKMQKLNLVPDSVWINDEAVKKCKKADMDINMCIRPIPIAVGISEYQSF